MYTGSSGDSSAKHKKSYRWEEGDIYKDSTDENELLHDIIGLTHLPVSSKQESMPCSRVFTFNLRPNSQPITTRSVRPKGTIRQSKLFAIH
jgi:hypothetical protein